MFFAKKLVEKKLVKKRLVKILGFSLFLLLASLIKISFVSGSHSFFFSGFLLLAPLAGAFFGFGGVGAAFLLVKIWRYLFLGTMTCMTAGIPTLAAAWCWSADRTKNKYARFFLNLVIPVISFFLFFFHPSVGHGFWFGLYWIIPVSIYLLEVFGALSRQPSHTFQEQPRS